MMSGNLRSCPVRHEPDSIGPPRARQCDEHGKTEG